MTPTERPSRSPTVLAVLLLIAAPALLLAPSLFGDRVYMPFDVARFAPKAMTLTDAERRIVDDPATPSNFDVTEIPVLVVPELQLARRELADGRFPHWNPDARFGAPLYANGLAAMAYPLNTALLLGGDPLKGLAFGAWIGFAIAGILGLLLLRRIGLGVAASLLGAIAFALGGTMTANAPFYMRANALVWLPGILLACLGIADARGLGRAPAAVGLALCTAMTLLAGFPPFAAAALLLAGLWSLPLLWKSFRGDGRTAAVTLAGWLLLGVTLGALLSAVQVGPMFAFFPESNREVAPTLAVTVSQAFDPMGLLGYVAPTAFGEPGGEPAYRQSALALLLWTRCALDTGNLQFPHDYNFTEYTVFAGSLPLLLALLGTIASRRRGVRWAAVCSAALFLIAAAPLWLAPFYRLPVFASVPPMRYVGPAAVLVALLAAAGLQALLDDRTPRRVLGVGIAGLAIAAGCLLVGLWSPLADHDAVTETLAARYKVPPEVIPEVIPAAAMDAAALRLDAALFGAVLGFGLAGAWLVAAHLLRGNSRARPILLVVGIAGTLVELGAFALPLNTGRPLIDGSDDTAAHRFLLERDATLFDAGGVTLARAAPEVKDPVDLPTGTLFPLGLRDLNSYAFVDAWSYRPFLALYGPEQMIRRYWPKAFPDDARLEHPFFDLIGLRYLLSTDQLNHAGVPVGPLIEGPGGRTFRIYERPDALPRAFVVHSRRVLDDDDAVVAALIAEDLDPRAAVLLTPAEAAKIEDRPPAAATGRRSARFVRDLPDEVVIEVGDGPAGDLVVCDTPLSGWTATVDGRPTPIARGNLFMRTVPVPAGACQVAFRYRTPGLTGGTILTVLAALAALALLLAAARSRSATRSSDELGGSSTDDLI